MPKFYCEPDYDQVNLDAAKAKGHDMVDTYKIFGGGEGYLEVDESNEEYLTLEQVGKLKDELPMEYQS